MSLLPEGYLKSTVYLKKDNSSYGTGFLIGIKNGQKNTEGLEYYCIFLVTNRHNITNGEILTIRFNKKDGVGVGEELVKIKEQKRMYYSDIDDPHHAEYVDVVMLQIDFDYISTSGYETYFIPEDSIVTKREYFENTIKVGHEMYLLGFPLGIIGLNYNSPIARQGIVARNDKELLDKKEFYLDVNNFPGNSGGPVILKPNAFALSGQAPILKAMIIGVIKSYSPYRKTYHDNSVNPPMATVMISENSGLAQGIPSYILYEMGKKYIEEQTQNTLFVK